MRVTELMERMVALLGLVVALPVVAIAALLVIWEDGTPGFWMQERVGKRGRLFRLVKLRSMYKRAGSGVTGKDDPRITRVGRILRKYKLDELPQLWNVVKGDMSFVGPRPELPKFVDMNNPLWVGVLSVRPGITSAATLVFRDEESLLSGKRDPEQFYREELLPKKLRLLDADVRARSFWSDLRVLALTVYCSLRPSQFDAASMEKLLFREGTN